MIDHDLDTAIDKITGFDLLNENKISPLINPPKPCVSPKQKRDNILHIQHQVLEELKWHCHERRIIIEQNNVFEPIQPFNPIASILYTIQHLAFKQELKNLENTIKTEFKIHF